MSKRAILSVLACLLCQSACVCQHYRAVAACGERYEGVDLRTESSAPPLYRTGNTYYVPAVRTAFAASYHVPVVGLMGLHEPMPRYTPIADAPVQKGFCRVLLAGDKWMLDAAPTAWVQELPAGAVPVRSRGNQPLQKYSVHPGATLTGHAMWSYPLAVLTFVGIDTPCMVVGNVPFIPVVICSLVEDLFRRRPPVGTEAKVIAPVAEPGQ